MHKNDTLSVIIPAYNEEKTIMQILNNVSLIQPILYRKLGIKMEIIVVDDGSKDKTAEKVRRFQKNHKRISLYLISQSNGGKGSAFKQGVKKARGNVIICQDADLEYDPRDYVKLVAPIIKHNALVVYGSRILNPQNKSASFLFLLGGKSITMLANLLYGGNLTDEPTCYKVFDARLLKSISIDSNSFAWEPEVTAKILRMGYKIMEVPISYRPRTVKEGKKIRWTDCMAAYWTLFKWRFKSFSCRLPKHFLQCTA